MFPMWVTALLDWLNRNANLLLAIITALYVYLTWKTPSRHEWKPGLLVVSIPCADRSADLAAWRASAVDINMGRSFTAGGGALTPRDASRWRLPFWFCWSKGGGFCSSLILSS